MADDAGFAAALTLRERLLNDALLLSYATGGSGDFPRTLAIPVLEGPPDASFGMFLGPPRIVCRDDDTLALLIDMWGFFTVTVQGHPMPKQARAALDVRVRPRFEVIEAVEHGETEHKLQLSLQPDDVTVASWDFSVFANGDFPPDLDSYLHGPLFRDRLTATLRFAIEHDLVGKPSFDLDFVDAIAAAADPDAPSRVRAGALMVGLDVTGYDTGADHITLHGDRQLLGDFARTDDLAAVVNPGAVRILLHDAESEVRDEVAKNGATLTAFGMEPREGRFHVSGQASNSDGTVNFSFSIVPALYTGRPGRWFQYLDRDVHVNAHQWPALRFTTADIAVDADVATWTKVVGALGGIIGLGILLYAESMAGETVRKFHGKIAAENKLATPNRIQRFAPDGPYGAPVRLELAEFEVSPDGVFNGIKVQVEAPPAVLIGPTSIPADLRDQQLAYRARLPLGVRAEDPALRIRWTVYDTASGHVLLNEDDGGAGRDTLLLVPQTVGPGLKHLGIACRVYRAIGAEITEILNDGVALQIRGALPPHAYLRWTYVVKNPQVRFDDAQEEWVYLGDVDVPRHSRIHRADQPCEMVARRSRYGEDHPLDALPFPVRYIESNRFQLCDYCFYGGPAGVRPAL